MGYTGQIVAGQIRHIFRAAILAVSALTLEASTLEALHAEESHPGMNAEVLYSEAVLALSHRQTRQALKTLDALLKEYPENIEGLELKALTLKNAGDEAKAIESYKKLIRLKPADQRGSYHYELGMIYYRQKNSALARYHLVMAAKLGTNPTISRFFLGMISFAEGRYPTAELHFRRVSELATGEMKLISLYYLGLIELKTGYSIGATRDLGQARALASAQITEAQSLKDASGKASDTKNAREIKSSTEQVLAPFMVGQWFSNVAVMAGYDSNVSQVPTSLASSNNASGMGTAKTNLSLGVGHMTAPMEDVQYVGSYRLNLNKNSSATTKSYEFVTNTASLYVNYLPLHPTQGGLKLEGNFMFQNQVQNGGATSDPNASYQYGKYNLSAEIGPFFRYQPTRRISTELDLYFRPQKYYNDDTESGLSVYGKVFGRYDFYNRWFTPGLALSYERNGASGVSYRADSVDIGLSNLFKVSPVDSLNFYFDFLSTKYPLTATAGSEMRADKNYAFRLNHAHTFDAHWTLLIDVSYTKNVSSWTDSYTYNRFQSGAGMSWSL